MELSKKQEWKRKGLKFDELVKEAVGCYWNNPEVYLVMEIEHGVDERAIIARCHHNKPDDVRFHDVQVKHGIDSPYVRVGDQYISFSEITKFGTGWM